MAPSCLREFFPDVESLKPRWPSQNRSVRRGDMALTDRAFERTPAARRQRQVTKQELASYHEWLQSDMRKVFLIAQRCYCWGSIVLNRRKQMKASESHGLSVPIQRSETPSFCRGVSLCCFSLLGDRLRTERVIDS